MESSWKIDSVRASSASAATADSLRKEENPELGPAAQATTEADFRALENLLNRLDPDRTWGGLSRTVTPEGLTLYLCREHHDAYRRTVRL